MQPSTSHSIKNALVDAQLVVDYCARAGRLHADDPLPTLIHEITEAVAKGENPYIGKLLHALSNTVNTIKDEVTLVEIRSGLSPFRWCYKMFNPQISDTEVVTKFVTYKVELSKAIPFVFLLLSFMFTYMAVDRFHTNSVLIKSASYFERLDADQLVRDIIRDIQYESTATTSGLFEYEKKIDSLKRAVKETESFSRQQMDLETPWRGSRIYNYIFPLPDTGFNSLANTDAFSQDHTTDIPLYVQNYLTKKPPAAAPDTYKSYDKQLKDLSNRPKECDELKNKLAIGTGLTKITLGNQYSSCLMDALGLSVSLDTIQKSKYYITRIRNVSYSLTSWYLPLAVGLLGASIFLLYKQLNESLPTVSLRRTILRFLMGGVAAIILSWFYAPARMSQNDIEMLDSLREFPFTFAFLAGFGVDSMLVFLTGKVNLLEKISSEPAEMKSTSKQQ